MSDRHTRILAIAAALLLAACDQLTKHIVVSRLAAGTSVNVLGEWLRIALVENTGVAFGLLRGRETVPIAVGAGAVLVLPWLILKGRSTRAELAGTAMILAGALGNLIDRLTLGYVVDFIDVGAGRLRWPAFNLADSLITLGAATLVVGVLRGRRGTA